MLLRFKDLKARGIVSNRVTLADWIGKGHFPPGIQLGPHMRAWTEDSINEWLASRPAGVIPPRRKRPSDERAERDAA